MTFYTVIRMEQVWEGAFNYCPSLLEVSIQGVLMEVEPLEEGRGRIVRLLHCPLDRYLDPALSPGAIISLTS